ncbi:hypothetical protein [Ferrovibrio sp.]|uniref:hypothetical protein n=1 Tax=Ferrovibrio sp. TaxID=1917215 RepID=UPI000CB2F592|nr:hypothetical protein [Ferrovibrio sp.]PJI39082.1 MAG: hypothetical protein CTR53_14335 [Ferrovibrio sp.]
MTALSAPAVQAQPPAQDNILWLKTDWPPVFMPDGKGFGDAVLAWLQARLPPGYSHETRRLPLPRVLKMMEGRQSIICTSNLLRTPAREAQFLISRDVMRMPALGLVVRSADVEAFRPLRDARGMVGFRELLHQPNLDGAINENRAYGAALDGLLRDPTIAAPLIRLSKTSTMVSMLAAKRVDWILLYPFEAIWLAREEQAIPALSTLGLAEIPAFNRGGVTCNRAPGADRLVAAIDGLIESHPDEPWLKPMYDWLDPETRQRLSAPH